MEVSVIISLLFRPTSDWASGSRTTLIAEICTETSMRILTVLSVAILASANAVAADQPAADADKAAIQALEDTYNEGFNSKDVDKIMSVYAPGKQLFVFDVVPPREYRG